MEHNWKRTGSSDNYMSERVSWNECTKCEAIQGAPYEPASCPEKSIWLPIRLRDKERDLQALQEERMRINATIEKIAGDILEIREAMKPGTADQKAGE